MQSKYPNTFYRVSLKAIIRNKAGHVLLVKESSDHWSLPGGGLDHGESIEDALKRELYEEAQIVGAFTHRPLGIDPLWTEDKSAWLLWVVYEVTIEDGFNFGVGQDATEVAFLDPQQFKSSVARSEQLVYKWCYNQNP